MRFLALPLLASLVFGTTAGAVPKAKATGNGPVSHAPPACGAKILPLVVGNTWKYEAVVSPLPAEEAIGKIAPLEPKFFTITVKSVDAQKNGDTLVALEEKLTYDLSRDQTKPKLDERTVSSTIVCNGKGKFEVSPDSYFFAGEPGGYYG